MLMKPLKALWRAAQSQYPQQSSEATVSTSFCLIQCSEIVYGMDCHSISQTYPCSTFQTRYASKLPLHLHLPPRCKSSALLVGLHFFSMKWTSTSPDLSLFFPIAGSDCTILLGIVHPYPSLHIQTAFFFLLFNWRVFPKAN